MATETAPDTVEQEPGEMFGPYRLEGTIGRGGMGEVFRAYDTARERTVALKRLRPALAQDDEYQDRFRRESRVAARLSSPHVVPIHDFGEIDGSLFIDMRLVSGHDLGAEIARGGRLEPARAADVVRQVADALDAAHDDGLVHRDVKPSNILLTTHRGRDFVYLVDFGIVRSVTGDEHSRGLTSTGLAVGTLSYMAPEMFLDGTVDRRADVYALACVLFETLTGRAPFTGAGPALMYEHLHAAAPRLSALLPGLPTGADAVLERGLAKDPAQRFASAGDLADAAVEALAPGPAVPTQRTATGDAASRPTVVTGPPLPPGHPSGPQGAHPGGPQGAPPTVAGPWSGPTPGAGAPGWGPPPPGYGPPAGVGPGAPYPAPRRRTPTAVWVVVAVLATVLVLVGGLVVVGLALGGGSDPAAPGTAAPAAGSPRPDDTSGRTVRAAFPDIAARNCQTYAPQDGEYATSSGVRPVALYRCAYGDAAPNGYVYYAQWPDQAGADRYQADQVATGPSTDGTDTWGPGRDTWGRMHTRQAQGYLYATGGYDTRPFTFDIAVTTIAERDAVLRTMTLLPADQLPVG